jgi:hypothetical protein
MSRKLIIVSVCLVLSLALTASAGTLTGAFTGPQTGAILSVDLNGGTSTQSCPTEGWNGSYSAPAFGADPWGVTWSPWGGPTAQYGDGTVLPAGTGVTSITQTFDAITLTVRLPGISTNYSSAMLNSRDRGSPTPNYTNDNDVFRDLLFVGGSGSNTQGTNYMQVQASGLVAGASYQIALYSYDWTGGHSMNWTAIAPYAAGGYTNESGFLAPSDEQTITWTSTGATQAPAVFTIIADGTGSISVWGFGGSGITGESSADTAYLNGIQITPEPATMALLGLGGLALIRRKR